MIDSFSEIIKCHHVCWKHFNGRMCGTRINFEVEHMR